MTNGDFLLAVTTTYLITHTWSLSVFSTHNSAFSFISAALWINHQAEWYTSYKSVRTNWTKE